jgi:hypothetical protein
LVISSLLQIHVIVFQNFRKNIIRIRTTTQKLWTLNKYNYFISIQASTKNKINVSINCHRGNYILKESLEDNGAFFFLYFLSNKFSRIGTHNEYDNLIKRYETIFGSDILYNLQWTPNPRASKIWFWLTCLFLSEAFLNLWYLYSKFLKTFTCPYRLIGSTWATR